MQANERQLINKLFQKIGQVANQGKPRDAQAEALINQQMQRIPGAAYYMVQAIIVQHQALKQAETQLQQRQTGSGRTTQQQRQAPDQPAAQSSGGGFLEGAAQTALGIGGGILIANAGMAIADSIFEDDIDAGDLFDAYDAGYEEAAGDLLDDIADSDDLDLDIFDALDDW